MSEGAPVREERATLPPPDWAPAESLRVRPTDAGEGVARRTGPKAEEGALRGRVARARRQGEAGDLWCAAVALAHFLAERERDLREAASLAAEALAEREDPSLRREASAWLETVGDVDGAADLLARGEPDVAALVRMGVLRARAGHADLASRAFERAAELDSTDAMALELRAILASTSPDVLDVRGAADAYVEAAARRRAAGALNGELEDLLRAFELDQTSQDVVEALAAALVRRGRDAAAEEVRRVTAGSFEGSARAREHLRRFEAALTAGDALRALDAGLAAGLDMPVDGSMVTALGTGLDDVLLRVGLFELLAARLEVAAENAKEHERAALFEQLARLCAGPLASPARAARAHVETLVADPSREEPVLALRAYAAATRDLGPLVEGLVRGAAQGDRAGRLRCARTLAAVVEGQLGDVRLGSFRPGAGPLGRWATRILLELGAEESGGADTLRGSVGDEDEAWRAALAEQLEGPLRSQGAALRRFLGLGEAAPDDVETRVALAFAGRARGDVEGAMDIVRSLVDQEPPSPRGLAVAWVHAGLAGDARLTARAIAGTAALCAPAVQAILLCEAAERFARSGDSEATRRAAERACTAEPTAPRPVATLAQAVVGARDRTAASALERAISSVFARGIWCEALADALEELGEIDYCVPWTQRLVALRPGDARALRTLLRRVELAKDGARLADTLIWALPQPWRSGDLTEIISDGLTSLALLDHGRASVVARRALDTFGPTDERLRAVLGSVADRTGDDALAAVLEERWAEVDPGRAAELWRSAARHRAVLGDRDGQARALCRALRAGAPAPELEAAVLALDGQTRSGDGLLQWLEGRARLFGAKDDAQRASGAWREYGAALWDLADDREGAIAAWCSGARFLGTGPATLAADLVRFGGAPFAKGRLEELIEAEPDPAVSGAMAAEAARVALALGESARAFELAQLALMNNGVLTDVLEVAERGAVACGRASELSRLYDAVGVNAFGRFGRHAAHHRGARFFEQRQEHSLALKHAIAAFLAVPSEGATLVLLERVAVAAGDGAAAVRTLLEVAREASSPTARAAWLLRAAGLAGPGEEAGRLRVDVLLEATLVAPSIGTLSRLGEAARELLRLAPDERDALELRFSRAGKALATRQEGPEGARVALALADLGLSIFDDVDGALGAVEHALAADADIDEYVGLLPRAALLAKSQEVRSVLDRATEILGQPYSNVGVAALRLLGAVARAAGEPSRAARFLLRAAESEPDDDALVCEADALATQCAPEPSSAAAVARFEAKVPRARRLDALLARAAIEGDAGRPDAAAALLERAIDLTGDNRTRVLVERRLHDVLEAAGRLGDLEARARRAAEQPDAPPPLRAARWLEVATMLEDRGDLAGAVDAVLSAARIDPAPLEPWSALDRLGSLLGRPSLRVRALGEIETRVAADARPVVLRRLAQASQDAGDIDGVEAAWTRLLELVPDDAQADQEIESVFARRGDYERLVEHLGRRAARLAGSVEFREQLRLVRLRRVAILEQRLGRVPDACAELERLTEEWPQHESALRYLADLYERTARYAQAVPVWRRLAALARDETTRADLELRSALAARAGGDGIGAARWTHEILDRSPGNVDALSLLADLARASSDDATLGVALAGLAASPIQDAVCRSDWLIDAAKAAERVGDPTTALERARQAAKIAPERVETQLLARALEYRLRGAGSEDDARATVAELSRVPGPVVGEDGALLAFLWAEAQGVLGGADSGLDMLEQARQKLGDHALLSLAIAERLIARRRFDEALRHLQIAANGTALGLRSRGRVAMAGGEAAKRAGEKAAARQMFAIAAGEADTAAEASPFLAALLGESEPSTPAHEPAVEAPAPSAPAQDRPETARIEDALTRMRDALAAGSVEAGDELVALYGAAPERLHEVIRVRRAQIELRPGDARLLAALRTVALADRNTTWARAIDHVARAFDRGAGPVAPPSLWAQVAQPGLLALLTQRGGAPPTAAGVGAEALALVWEGAGSVLARTPQSYSITGVERVVPGPTSAISRLYEAAIRLLGVPSIPLYVRRPGAPVVGDAGTSDPRLAIGPGAPRAGVALLASPSAMLTGDLREDTPLVRFALGQALAAALPQNVLLFGLPEATARAVWAAVLTSFGPPAAMRGTGAAESARWTTTFWSTIAGRLQRRLQDLLAHDPPPFADVADAALQAARRTGLFVAGDVGTAVAAVCADPSVGVSVPQNPDELDELASAVPAIADLLRLATRPEYADARWRTVPEGSARARLSSGRFRLS